MLLPICLTILKILNLIDLGITFSFANSITRRHDFIIYFEEYYGSDSRAESNIAAF